MAYHLSRKNPTIAMKRAFNIESSIGDNIWITALFKITIMLRPRAVVLARMTKNQQKQTKKLATYRRNVTVRRTN
jgi:hypothetical protein